MSNQLPFNIRPARWQVDETAIASEAVKSSKTAAKVAVITAFAGMTEITGISNLFTAA